MNPQLQNAKVNNVHDKSCKEHCGDQHFLFFSHNVLENA